MYIVFKRLSDIVFSLTMILILTPVLIPVIIGLLLTGERYVFYKQERVGFKNKKFYILKFATMLKDSPNMKGGYLTTDKDPRLTPMGGFLRKSKINELPQLFNIFLGHMSLIGPRPVMPISFQAYPQEVKDVIYNVKPGLSGIGSVIFRDEEQLITKIISEGGDASLFYKNTIYPLKGELEKWYQKNQSLLIDINLILLTLLVILSPESNLPYKVFKDLPRRNF